MRSTIVLMAMFMASPELIAAGTNEDESNKSPEIRKGLWSQSLKYTMMTSPDKRGEKGSGVSYQGQNGRLQDKNLVFIDTNEWSKERARFANGEKRNAHQISPKSKEAGKIQDSNDILYVTKQSIVPSKEANARIVQESDLSNIKDSDNPSNAENKTRTSKTLLNISTKSKEEHVSVSRSSSFKESFSDLPYVINICEISIMAESQDLLQSDSYLTDRRDMFNCSHSAKCLCKFLDPAQSGRHNVLVDCEKRNLLGIPFDLPTQAIRLDISYNFLFTIHLQTVMHYKSLQTLQATDSDIHIIENVKNGTKHHPLQILDLRYNRIQSLSSRVFAGFPKLRVLYLQGNQIQHIRQDMFARLSHLKFLDLAINDLRSIENGTFDYMIKLEGLSLSGNYRLGYDKFSAGLFKNLTRLKSLKIQGCSNGATDYPNQAIGVLKNLEDLNIDALANPAKFGPQFADLKRLKILSFGPYADCRLVNMSESFFEHFQNLPCLYFHSCNISRWNENAYSSFDNLKALTINSVPSMTLDKAFSSLAAFRTKSLEYIGFQNLTNWDWPCVWLKSEQGKTMNGFVNLTTINLSNNRLSLLSDSFIGTIPRSVKSLIMRDNKFTLMNILWASLKNLPNLAYIDVSFQNMAGRDFFVPFHQERDDHTYLIHENRGSELISYHYQTEPQIGEQSRSSDKRLDVSFDVLNIPENLQTVIASYYHNFGGILLGHAVGKNSLKHLNFSRSGLNMWGRGKLPQDVEMLDVSVNSAVSINKDFFHPNNSLTQLHIQVNFLGDFIHGANKSVFRHLKKLRYLDMSTNEIFAIPYDFFDGLQTVDTIVLANNRLESLNVSFQSTKRLRFLDLHKNSLSWISESTRNHLDQLSKPNSITVDLHYNSLMCTCDYIHTLHWMAETNVYFLNMPLYQCRDNENRLINIGSKYAIKTQVDYLRRKCKSYGYMIFGIVALCLIFMIIVMAAIAYRKRWWIRYKKHVFFAKRFGFKPKNGQSSGEGVQYKYDAYLLYVWRDRHFALTCSEELESARNHKLCIGDRDILPGTDEIDAIVSAVQNSRLTLVAITDNFIADMNNQFKENPKLDYALRMALMEEYCTKRHTLHLILNTSVDGVKFPPYILKVFRDDFITALPSDNEEASGVTDDMRQAFWDKLSSTIGHCTLWNHGTRNDEDGTICSYPYHSHEGPNSS